MGGAVSAGEDNDDLIDNLVSAEYIKRAHIEKVFRSVDRGDYYTEGNKLPYAYRDLAWKQGNLHLSAPCIYSEVLESLDVKAGQSFLNLGSGTGYFSTMVGLLLGAYGVNHGIEIYEDVLQHANDRLAQFKRCSLALDEFEFSEPKFILGNCLQIDVTNFRQYDRVYCGASCPPEHENYLKNLLKIGGILVMPFNDQLLKITRLTENSFDVRNVLPVSFASLITPIDNKLNSNFVKLPDVYPLSLQEICRSSIRVLLRKAIDNEHKDLSIKNLFFKRQQAKLSNDKQRKNSEAKKQGRTFINGFDLKGKRKQTGSVQTELRIFECFENREFTSDEDNSSSNTSSDNNNNNNNNGSYHNINESIAGNSSNNNNNNNGSSSSSSKSSGSNNSNTKNSRFSSVRYRYSKKSKNNKESDSPKVKVRNSESKNITFGQTVAEAVGMILEAATYRSNERSELDNGSTSKLNNEDDDDEKRNKRSISVSDEDDNLSDNTQENSNQSKDKEVYLTANTSASSSSSIQSNQMNNAHQSPFKKRHAVITKTSDSSSSDNLINEAAETTGNNDNNYDVNKDNASKSKEDNENGENSNSNVDDDDSDEDEDKTLVKSIGLKIKNNSSSSNEMHYVLSTDSDDDDDDDDDDEDDDDENLNCKNNKGVEKVKQIDKESYTIFMREKLKQLPLPCTVLRFLNHNRDLN